MLLLTGLAACQRKLHDLSTQQLSTVVVREQPTLKHCYDEALVTHPYKQEMRLEAQIHIAPSGKVTGVELHGGGGLPGMGACLRYAITRWRFPQAPDPTDTSLPLVFHPEVKPPQPNLDTLRQAFEAVGAQPAKHP